MQPGWQVLVMGQPASRPLLDQVTRQIARRGAYALVRLRLESPVLGDWLSEASDELASSLSEIEIHEWEQANAYAVILAPANTREGSDVDPTKIGLRGKALASVHGAVHEPREELGRLLLPDRGGRPGRRHDPPAVRGLLLGRDARRLGAART